jgi:hypothetical protein
MTAHQTATSTTNMRMATLLRGPLRDVADVGSPSGRITSLRASGTLLLEPSR